MDWIRWENIKWEPGNPESVYLLCAKNGCVIEERLKTWMMAPENGAEWRATAPPDVLERAERAKTHGYHISALYSPWGWKSWVECVAEFLEKKDDPSLLKTFVNTVLGETWDERPGDVEPDSLLARREEFPAPVPDGVGVLVASVDTQDDGLVYQVTGWGHAEESWIVDFGHISGDPGLQKVWRELDAVRDRLYLHQSGQQVPIEIMVVDAGGHHWNEVLAYTKPRLSRRVFAIFGSNRVGVDLVGKPSNKNRARARTFPLCVDTGKDTLFGRLKITPPLNTPPRCPGYIHLPKEPWCDKEYAAQLTSEYPDRVYLRGRGWTHKWTKNRERNEAWDVTVYALAALHILGAPVIQNLTQRAAALSVRVTPDTPPPPPAPTGPPAFLKRRGGFVTGRGRLRRF
jgi:terminase, large subunit